MNYEEMIEDDVDSVIEPTEEELAPEPEIQPAKSPWRAFILEVDLSFVETRLEAFGARISEVENGLLDVKIPEQEPVDLSGLETRLSGLETRLAELEAAPRESADSLNETQLSELNSRISALENQPAPEPVIERVSILAFPKAQLIQAVEDNQTGGIVEKTLSRHVRVKNPNDPLTLIDGIETDLSEGRLTDAAKKFERLPAPVRSAGQAWYESVKASL